MKKQLKTVRLLLLEDNPRDVELIETALVHEGITFNSCIASSETEFEHALKEFSPDIILLDYGVPDCDGMSALQLVKSISPNTPAIVVTSPINEETAVGCMKAGAADYVLKNRLVRLAPAVISALEMRERLDGATEEWRRTFDSLSDGISIHDSTRTILKANEALGRLLGIPADELVGQKCFSVLHGAVCAPPECPLDVCIETGKAFSYETFEPKLGRWLSISISPMLNGSIHQAKVVHVVRDITGRKAAEQALAEGERRFRSLIENTSECICNIDPAGMFIYMSPGGLESHDLTLEDIRQMHFTDLAEAPYHKLLLDRFEEAKESGRAVRFEYESDTVDGVRWFQSTLSPLRDESGHITSFIRVSRDIQDQKRAQDERDRLFSAVEQLEEMLLIADPKERVTYVNPAFEKITGYSRAEVIGQRISRLGFGPEDGGELFRQLRHAIRRGRPWQGRLLSRKKDGGSYQNELHISPVIGMHRETACYVAVMRDVSEEMARDLQLAQAQKLEAIGQLAAGIAHEINTPTQYVSDNTRFLSRSFDSISEILSAFGELKAANLSGHMPSDLIGRIDALIEDSKLDYLMEECPQAIDEALSGLGQIANIVLAMKEFSHPGTKEKSAVNINKALESTITVSRNEWKYVADLVAELDPDLPLIPGLPGDLKQVFLNLFVNAAHAIEAKNGKNSANKGVIQVKTATLPDCIEIRVSDNGAGIPDELGQRVFEPFFTTKDVGQGTGQGLAISRSVIVDKHGGSIDFESSGEGTHFLIRLPREK